MPGLGEEFLDELRRLADPDDLPALLAACRGRRVHMPRGDKTNSAQDSWLKDAVGREKATALILRFKAESWIFGDIDVPMEGSGYYPASYGALRREMNLRFEAAVRAGKTNNQIARDLGISRRAVTYRKQKLRQKGIVLAAVPEVATDRGDE